MNNKLKVILILACVSVVWAIQSDKGGTTKEQQTAIEKAILKVHSEMMKAGENRDAEALFSQENIDGGLVGGASLEAESLYQIILAAEKSIK